MEGTRKDEKEINRMRIIIKLGVKLAKVGRDQWLIQIKVDYNTSSKLGLDGSWQEMKRKKIDLVRGRMVQLVSITSIPPKKETTKTD